MGDASTVEDTKAAEVAGGGGEAVEEDERGWAGEEEAREG